MINVENELISYEIRELLGDLDSSIELELLTDDKVKNDDVLIEEIINIYFSNKELSDEYMSKIRYDYDFKIVLLENIQARMKRIISDNSTLLFKEIVSVVNLLSLGKKFVIFEQYNEVSNDEISRLFREYEEFLRELFEKDKRNFDLTFNFYLTLIEAYNELCIINSTDIKRKQSISTIIEHCTESINMLKFTTALDEEKLSMLSNIQGKFLFFYSHVTYVSTKNKPLEDLLYEYKFILEKQMDGYFLSSDTKKNEENNYYLTLLANSSNLLLLLLMKLEDYEDVTFEKLKSIVDIFKKECKLHFAIDEINSIKAFKEALLNNFVYIYHHDLKITYNDLIQEIIKNDNFTSSNMQIIHNIILFSDNISKEELNSIVESVLKIPKFTNDYHEYYKLKVIDVVINKLIKSGNINAVKYSVKEIISYIETSNTASHLMSVFSKIFLSLSYYYSLLEEDKLLLSQKMYFIGEKICAYTLIKNEYEDIYKEILLNHANTYLKVFNVNSALSKRELINIAQNRMKDFLENEEIRVKYNLNYEIGDIIQQILKTNEIPKEELEEKIANLISKKIFFGLAKCFISSDDKNLDEFNELGYEIYEQELVEGYKILYKYPYSYKNSFNAILDESGEYIENNIINLILSYTIKIGIDASFSNYIVSEEIL